MYAVMITGGKQYKVQPGQYLKIEQLAKQPGDELRFDNVLMIADQAGAEITVDSQALTKAWVKAELVENARAKKIIIRKFKRRKHHLKTQGHRQNYSLIKVLEIVSE